MSIMLVALTEQLDVEQAGILEGQPGDINTNWDVISGLLPIGSLETLAYESYPGMGNRKSSSLVQSSREVYQLSQSPGLPPLPADAQLQVSARRP